MQRGPLSSEYGTSNMAHLRQPRPDSGLAFQVKGMKSFLVVPSSLGNGVGVGNDLTV